MYTTGIAPPVAIRRSVMARLKMPHSFNRVGNAPRFVFQISNLKYEISNRTITRLNEQMPTASLRCRPTASEFGSNVQDSFNHVGDVLPRHGR